MQEKVDFQAEIQNTIVSRCCTQHS